MSAPDESVTKTDHRPAFVAAGSLVATGLVLAVTYFPLFFDKWAVYDDEGVFTGGLRALIAHHGHLYSTIWSDKYGPFYYLVMSTVFRAIHQQPNLGNSRWILLVLTTGSTVLFGAAVWRVVKSIPAALVAEVAVFALLMTGAGYEPSHPGALEVFLVAIVAFALASWVATRRIGYLVVVGLATGALTMTKINAGGFVAVALVFAFVVGNVRMPRFVQIIVAVLTALVPIAVVYQLIEQTQAAVFAVVVVAAIVGMIVLMSIDQVPLSRLSLLPVAAGGVVAILVSLAFPLFYGTSLADELRSVFLSPVTFGSAFAILPAVGLDWLPFVVTVGAIAAAFAFRSFTRESRLAQATWVHAVLAALALWVLGLGVISDTMAHAPGWTTARWVPLIVALPAVAFCGGSSEPIRLALRLLVSLGLLQVLVSYPVAGTQVAWATVAMVVPCAIALAVGLDHSRAWREASRTMRTGATVAICVSFLLIAGTSPTAAWNGYTKNSSLGVPGTGLMRINPAAANAIHDISKEIRTHCDTFYGVPNLPSFHIFSGVPPLTGMVANGSPADLTLDQQHQITVSLRQKLKSHERVCIIRSTMISYPPPPGEIGRLLKKFNTVVAKVGPYTLSRHRFSGKSR